MKILLLLRHGKAAGSDPAGDHARALTERGQDQARLIGTLIRRLGLEPDLAFVSDARRTRETAELALGPDLLGIIHLDGELYAASPQKILSVIQAAAEDAARVLVVGHNPGIGEVARALAGSGEPQALVGLQGGFPTGALADLEFDARTWSDLRFGAGSLSRFVVPDRIA